MSSSRVSLRAVGAAFFPPALAAGLVAVLAGAFLTHSDFHNPLDEYTHFDFVIKVAQDLNIPMMRDTMGQTALQEWACSGEPSFAALTCGDAYQDPSRAPWSGSSPATQYATPYYLLTGLATRLLHTTLPGLSWMDSARVASVMWLAGLAALIVAVGRRLGGPTTAAVAAGILVCSLPQVLIQGSSVNNDIPAVFLTFLTLWVWLLLRDSRPTLRWGLSLAVAVVAMLVKQHAIVALALIAVLELVQRLRGTVTAQERDPSTRAWFRSLAVVGGGAGLAVVVFGLLYYVIEPAWRGLGPPIVGIDELIRGVEPQDFGLANAKAYGEIGTVFIGPSYVAGLSTPWATNIAAFAAMAAFGGLVYAVLRSPRPWRADSATAVRQVTFAYVALFPVAFMVYLKMVGQPLFYQPRYHLIGLCIGLAMIFIGASRRWGIVALVGAVAIWAFLLGEVLALPAA